MKKNAIFESKVPIGVVFDCHVNGLGIIRSLGEKNIPTLALDCNPRGIGLFSKYCYSKVCPDPANNEKEFVDFLLEIGKALKSKGVLFPTNDKWLIAISKYREELERYYLFPMSKWDIIQNCVDKIRMYKIADKAHIPIPETLFCQDISKLKEVSSAIKYPCIIKPNIPPEFDKVFKTRFVRIERWDDITNWLENNKMILNGSNIGFIIQEVIPGDASCLYTFSAYSNTKAEIVSFSVICKVRQAPPDYGTITSGEIVRQPKVIELGTFLIKNLGYHGLSNIEFKRDQRDGKFKLMEINARSGMSIYYTTKSGVNLPYFAYQEAIGNKLTYRNLEGDYGKRWIVFLNDLISSLRYANRGNHSIRSIRVGRFKGFGWHKKMIEAVYSLSDPLPGIVFTWNYLFIFLRFLRRKLW